MQEMIGSHSASIFFKRPQKYEKEQKTGKFSAFTLLGKFGKNLQKARFSGIPLKKM